LHAHTTGRDFLEDARVIVTAATIDGLVSPTASSTGKPRPVVWGEYWLDPGFIPRVTRQSVPRRFSPRAYFLSCLDF
jgi:hypothetical protein